MNNLLGRSLLDYINSPLIIVGLILLAFGLALVVLAKRIARVSAQKNEIDNDDKIYVAFKIAGILLMLAGFILISIDIIIYIVNRKG